MLFFKKKYTDDELLVLLTAAEEKDHDKALRFIYNQFFNPIARYIKNNNGSKDDAEDIFQDGIITLFHKVRERQFKLEGSIMGYLFAICKNLWLNKLRQHNRETSLSEAPLETWMVHLPSEHLPELSERGQQIVNLIKQLKEDCQEILHYFYFDNLKMALIAKKMSFANEQSARNKKSKCMKKLNTLIQEQTMSKG